MKKDQHITAGALAKRSGVSVRTLHYYEEIRLLVPGRSTAGYRLYGPEDGYRLQQILIRRSMGLPLEQIRQDLDDPNFDHLSSLKHQKSVLLSQNRDIRKMIASVEAAIIAIETKEPSMPKSDIFDGFDPSVYSAETKERWGDTKAYAQSKAKTRNYSDQDWAVQKSEQDKIWSDAAVLMKSSKPPHQSEGLAIAARHRAHIERWFYSCSSEQHGALADMWLSDERFKASIDAFGEGLTKWIAAAVKASY